MKKKVKVVYPLFYLIIISLLHLSFTMAKPGFENEKSGPAAATIVVDSSVVIPTVKSIYDSLQLDLAGLSRQAFDYAVNGWEKLNKQGKLDNQSVIGIIDFSQPSSNKRLYVLDMNNYALLFNTLVAHGRNSGKQQAISFSNKASS